jgi:hypothetical protein
MKKIIKIIKNNMNSKPTKERIDSHLQMGTNCVLFLPSLKF